MPRRDHERADLDDVHTQALVDELCKRMKLKQGERERFKDTIMMRCGFKRETTYVDAEPEEDAYI